MAQYITDKEIQRQIEPVTGPDGSSGVVFRNFEITISDDGNSGGFVFEDGTEWLIETEEQFKDLSSRMIRLAAEAAKEWAK